MIEEVQIIETAAKPTAIIQVMVAQDEIQNVMGPTIQELMSAIAAQGIAPAGPWFTHHLRRPAETFDFEVSVPVLLPITAAGRVQPSAWPALRAARTIYHGAYEELGAGWSEFLDWLETHGHEPTEDLWETYIVGPEAGDDASVYRTELIQPLRA